MAIAERWLRTHFGRESCDHHTFVIAGDGCLDGGHLATRRPRWPATSAWVACVYVYDDNHITIDGPTELAYDDDVAERFEAYGWHVRRPRRGGQRRRRARGRPAAGAKAEARTDPSLLVLRSHIGWPSPQLTDTAKAHGDPFGAEEIRVTKEILGLPADETFWVPDEVRRVLRPAAGPRGRGHAGLGGAPRGLGRRPGRLGRRAGRARPAGLGRRPARPSRPGEPHGHPQAINTCLDATADRLPGLLAGARRPDRQHRRDAGRGRDPVRRDPGRQPGPLRHPRARHGRRS